MPAIADILIKRPATQVWAVIADASTHPHWLGRDAVTKYLGDGPLAEGMKFTRVTKHSGATTEGEVVAVRSARFLKVRVDSPAGFFAITEYHLIPVEQGCVLRAVYEVFDTGEARHGYFPEAIEREMQDNLERLRNYCEAG